MQFKIEIPAGMIEEMHPMVREQVAAQLPRKIHNELRSIEIAEQMLEMRKDDLRHWRNIAAYIESSR